MLVLEAIFLQQLKGLFCPDNLPSKKLLPANYKKGGLLFPESEVL